mgnify:CR=1 FL=1
MRIYCKHRDSLRKEWRRKSLQIENLNNPVSKNVLRIIKEKGMKQCVVAERAGYSRSALNNMLNGRKVMKICDVVKLKETLGVDANELYKSE